MNKQANTKQVQNSAVAPAIAGAVVGAGAAVAATKVLADKKTRDKIVSTLGNIKDEVLKTVSKEDLDKEMGKRAKRVKAKANV